jgi:carbonic anhydrase
MRTQTREIQANLTPRRAFDILRDGNRRFVSNLSFNRNLLQQVNETSDGQHPFAIVLSCIDSRTSAELIFDQGLGDIFSARIAGNVLNDDILGSMEFACKVAGAKLVVVLGHTRCGAIKGACNHVEMGHLTGLLNKIAPALHAVRADGNGKTATDDLVELVAVENMRHQMRAIVDRSPILEHLLNDGQIGIVGGIYSVESGVVEFTEEVFDLPLASRPSRVA